MKSNYEINMILHVINVSALNKKDVFIKNSDLKLLNEYIKDQELKVRQLKDLISYLNAEIINLSEELNQIEL